MTKPSRSKAECQEILEKLGLPTFPLPLNSKKPKLTKFYDHATVKPSFSLESNNGAVSTGVGFIVLDFDIRPEADVDGRESLAEYDMLGLPHSLRVKTPSGGFHVYLATDTRYSNSAKLLKPGVDIRAYHAFVVAPGSSIDGNHYEIIGEVPSQLSPVPSFLIPSLKELKIKDKSELPATDLDTEDAIASVVHYLETTAGEAVSYQRGNDNTVAVANAIGDKGVSEQTAYALMLNHWNETKAIPPWDPDELRGIVANAYSYRQNTIGVKSPTAEFDEPLTPEQLDHIEQTRLRYQPNRPYEAQPDTQHLTDLSTILQPMQPFDIATEVKPREYTFGKFMAKRYVTALISPPGVGKTTFGITAALSIATGRPLLGDHFKPNPTPQNVLYWSQEDDHDEIKMRLTAALRLNGLSFADTVDPGTGNSRLHLFSGTERPLHMAVFGEDRRTILPSQDAKTIAGYIKDNDIVAAMFDPFLEFHPADENSNNEIAHVARVFRRIAIGANTSVLVVHHTRKHNAASSESAAGDMDSGRGAGSFMGVVRVAATLYPVSEKTANEYAIPQGSRHEYVQFDDAKSNLSLIGGHPIILKREGVPIAELDDTIGALTPADVTRVVQEDMPVYQFEMDIAEVLTRMFARDLKWVKITDLVREMQAFEDTPAEYALSTGSSLRKRLVRCFDEASGVAISEHLDHFLLRKKPGAPSVVVQKNLSGDTENSVL